MSYNLLAAWDTVGTSWTGGSGATWGHSSASGSNLTYPDGVYTNSDRCALGWSPTVGTGEAYATMYNVKPHLIPSHKYYFRIWVRLSTSSQLTSSIDVYWPIQEPPVISGFTLTQLNVWTKCSAIFTRSTFTEGDYNIRLDWNNPGTNSSSNQIGFCGAVLVDLTDLYGAGNEPTDKDYLDQNITWNVDKYTTTSTELTAVANAIRTNKGQARSYDGASYDPTTLAKPFPNQFVTDISSLGFRLIATAEYTIENFTTTSATSHASIALGSSAYTSNSIIYVKVRDKAGPRNNYFVGSDAFFFNYQKANNGTSTLTYAARTCHRKSDAGAFSSYNGATTTCYGVYGYSITSAGNLNIYKRYSSSYSLTIDGTYVVEVYQLDYSPNGNPFSYTYS